MVTALKLPRARKNDVMSVVIYPRLHIIIRNTLYELAILMTKGLSITASETLSGSTFAHAFPRDSEPIQYNSY
jgi:hypothetical protein